MLARIVFFALAVTAPLVSASAASQFNLNVDYNPSLCWLKCHAATIATVHNLDDDPLGNNEALGANCADVPYITTMPICLITACESAPDVAYAVEFGQRWCAKAGVDVSNTLVLPADYTEGVAKEYFQSQAYLSSAAASFCPATMVVAAVALSFGPLFACAL